MTKQYTLPRFPSSSGYSKPHQAPVILAMQLAVDISNLVGTTAIDHRNRLYTEAADKLRVAIKRSRDLKKFLGDDGETLMNCIEQYLNLIESSSPTKKDFENAYNSLIASLHVGGNMEEVPSKYT